VPSPPASLTTLVAELAASRIEFILVGGLAAVAQGAPVTTHDVDIVPRRSSANIDLLHQFLCARGSYYRGRQDRLEPTRDALLGPGHHLLSTDLGPLDVLGAIEGGRDYDALLPRSMPLKLDDHPLHVLSLSMLVELKRESSRAKDKLMLLILEAMLQDG
jgi:hypothetical protein